MSLINCKYIWVAQRNENTEELIKNNISIVSYLFNSYGYEYSYYYLLPYQYCKPDQNSNENNGYLQLFLSRQASWAGLLVVAVRSDAMLALDCKVVLLTLWLDYRTCSECLVTVPVFCRSA